MKSLTMKNLSVLSTALLIGSSLTFWGCGSKSSNSWNLVKNVQGKTYTVGNDAWGEITTTLDTGDIGLPSFELPIADPRTPMDVYGKLSMRGGFTGMTDVVIAVNITQATKRQALEPKLPNGTALPIGGLNGTDVIALQVGKTAAMIYIAMNNNVAMIGTAIPLKELDKLGRLAGSINLFPAFTFANGIRGSAGLFSGMNAGENGIAFFLDVGTLINKPAPATGIAVRAMASSTAVKAAAPISAKSSLVFYSLSPSQKKVDSVNKYLYDMHKRKARTSVSPSKL